MNDKCDRKAHRSHATLSSALVWTGLIAVCAVGDPERAVAQLGFVRDPICDITRLKAGQQAPADGAQITGAPEYDVKAAMLYRCLQLVHWPASASAGKDTALTLGLLGKNSSGASLARLNGKIISGRKLVVKKLSRLRDAARCQSVFVFSSETNRTASILNQLASLPVLTVGESPGFAEQGGIVNLLVEGNHVRLEINTAAADKARLVIDPELIKLVPLTAEPSITPTNSAGS